MFGGARRVVYITQNIAGLHNLEYSGHPFLALGEQMGMANSMNAFSSLVEGHSTQPCPYKSSRVPIEALEWVVYITQNTGGLHNLEYCWST